MQTTTRPEEDGERNQTGNGGNAVNTKSYQRGKITIFVHSKRAFVDFRVVRIPLFSGIPGTHLAYESKRVAVYENVLDDGQKEALENYEALAKSLGIELEVKDLARSNVFIRLLNSIMGTKFPSKTPSVSLSCEALYRLTKGGMPKEDVSRVC
jgi:hypothetical protein